MPEARMHLWRLSWRMLWRDWRSGELSILAIGLVIAVTSITAVGFFSDRVERGLNNQAAELIGADLVVASSRSSVNDHANAAQAQGFEVAETAQFRSVVINNNQPQLIEVKAVTANYPLRGDLRISDELYTQDQVTHEIPARGEIWVEPRLLQLLNLDVGARINLGALPMTISRVLTYEPDRGGDFFSVAPRVLMNQQDIAASGLIGQGALVSYRLLISGEPIDIEIWRNELLLDLRPGERLLSVQEGRPELRNALQRAQRFLGFAAMISVLLAGVAVATVAYRFSRRHLDTSAMLRCLGASQSTIVRLFTLEMLWLAVLSSSVGCVLGLLTQLGIAQILDKLFLTILPAPSLKPLILGYATGIIMLLGFAMPPLLALKQVPPLRVLRKNISVASIKNWQLYLAVMLTMGVLLFWQLSEAQLVLYVMLGLLATLLVLAVAAWGLIALLGGLRGRVGVAWRFGLANIARRPASSVIQVVALGLGIMVMLLLSTVRSDLLNDWQQSLPVDAPNHFVINVQPDQVDAIQKFFNQHKVIDPKLYPMVRARLVAINGRSVSTDDYTNERAKHMLTREFNLSWAEKPQADNEIIAGEWWQASDHGRSLLSLEVELAETLGIRLNDSVAFDINGTQRIFEITNLRTVEWDTFNINFFTVVPPGLLETAPASWVTSIYLDKEQKQQLGRLVQQFPNVTVIDVDAIMSRVRAIINRVSLAVEFIFIFTILAGLAVLYAAIQANQDERRYESAMLRTLGASKKVLLQGLYAEFITLGALAGLLAGLSATLLAYVLAEKIFQFDYGLDISLGLSGVIAGVVIVGVAGLLGTRRVLNHPPIETLRQAS